MRTILLASGRAPALMMMFILAALYYKNKNESEKEKEKAKPVK